MMQAEQLPKSAYTNSQDLGFHQPHFTPERPEGQHTAEMRDQPLVMGDPKRSVRRNVRGDIVEKVARRVFCVGHIKYVEAPKGSGNLFFEGTNEPAGRVEQINGKANFKFNEPHKTYVPSLPREAQYHQILTNLQQENEQLKQGIITDNGQSDLEKRIAELEARAIQAEQRADQAEKKAKVAVQEASKVVQDMEAHYQEQSATDGNGSIGVGNSAAQEGSSDGQTRE